MRCQVNCSALGVQVPGSGRTRLGEGSRAVAQTHTATEHPWAAPSALAVSSEQPLQPLPLIIR